MLPTFTVLLRDVAPTSWPRCLRVLAAVREVAPVPVTLLVVPRLHGQARSARFDDALAWRLWLGDELVLHGYMHEGSAEFQRLGCDEALQRLHAGMRWFSANRWPLTGFAAPKWRLGPQAWSALRMTPLLYTLTRHGIHVLARDEELGSHSVALGSGGWLARTASLAWNAWPGQLGQDAAPLVRLELTPDAADHRAVRMAWQRCLQRHLRYREAQTVGRLVQAWQPALLRAGTAPTGSHRPSSAPA